MLPQGNLITEGMAVDQVIGMNVKNLLDFIETTHGKESKALILNSLPESSKQLFSDRIIVSDWYPMADHLTLYSVICQKLYSNDSSKGYEVGRSMARKRITVFQRMFLKFTDPEYVIKRSSATWSLFYRPSRMESEILERGKARGRVVGMEVRPSDRFFCNVFAGHLASFVEASGSKEFEINHTSCRSEGAEFCEFEGYWI